MVKINKTISLSQEALVLLLEISGNDSVSSTIEAMIVSTHIRLQEIKAKKEADAVLRGNESNES